MSGGMPYQLEKGPYFSVTESMLNLGSTPEQRLAVLKLMVARTPADDLPSLESTSLDAGPQGMSTADRRRDHMNEHWFGKTFNQRSGRWEDQPAFNTGNPRSTGYWHQWYGNAEAIVGETFIRAVEVSLGLDHITPTTDLDTLVPTRFWPIEVFWRCPAPWMEGWVTWRRETDGTGHVTVHLHTPGHRGSVLLLSPVRSAPDNARPDYLDNPTRSDMARGMWVIAHLEQKQHPFYAVTNPSPPGQWRLPTFGPFVESRGPIVTVQPNEPDGGVLANGRPYTP